MSDIEKTEIVDKETPETPAIPRYTAEELAKQLDEGTFETGENKPPEKVATPAAGDKSEQEKPQEDPAATIARLEKVNKDAQSYIGKRNNELGELRKENAETRALLTEMVSRLKGEAPRDKTADFFTDPEAAVKATVESLEKTKKEQAAKEDSLIEEHRAMLKEWDPEFDEVALRRGIEADVKDKDQVEEFIHGQVYKAPVLAHLLNQRGKLLAKVEALEKENLELKKGPAKVLKKVADAAKTPRGTTGASEKPVEESNKVLSLAEIKAALAPHRRKG